MSGVPKRNSACACLATLFWVIVLLVDGHAWAQSPGAQTPASGDAHSVQSFPDKKPPRELSTGEVEQQIQEKLRTEPALSNLDLHSKVTDSAVLVSGTVDSEQQHVLAMRIVESFAAKRKLQDKIKVQEDTSPQ
jgi:osmotically-inducible protein OsmY